MGSKIPAMDDVKAVTHLLAVDVTSKKGIKLLREGIRYLVIPLCYDFWFMFKYVYPTVLFLLPP